MSSRSFKSSLTDIEVRLGFGMEYPLPSYFSLMAGETLADARTGRNARHALVGLLRQSVFGRLAGYEDVNDAERLRHDPAIR
jgi:Transposase DDE domain group 1